MKHAILFFWFSVAVFSQFASNPSTAQIVDNWKVQGPFATKDQCETVKAQETIPPPTLSAGDAVIQFTETTDCW